MKQVDELVEFIKPKKIRKDRRHNEKQFFDDEVDSHKKAGRKGHSRLQPVEVNLDDIDSDHPYGNFDDWKRYLK
jgi:hypothetical protein